MVALALDGAAVMGRGVRATSQETIRHLTDGELFAYVAETKRRVAAASNAAIRNNYKKQLAFAEAIKAERVGKVRNGSDAPSSRAAKANPRGSAP